jgi:hypothetical protein
MIETNLQISLNETNYRSFDLTKKGVITAAQNIYSDIMDNGTSAIRVAEMFKFIEETQKQLKEITDENGKNNFTDLVREEITKNSDDGKTYTSKSGNTFEIVEAGVKYDYSVCGDPIWNRLNAELESIKEKIKEREVYLKTIKSATPVGNVLDNDTSELHENVELYPPVKTSTSTFKQTLLKG